MLNWNHLSTTQFLRGKVVLERSSYCGFTLLRSTTSSTYGKKKCVAISLVDSTAHRELLKAFKHEDELIQTIDKHLSKALNNA
jgi:hypothetical protein